MVCILPVDEFTISHFIRTFRFVLSNFERWPYVTRVTTWGGRGLRNSGFSEVCDRGGEGVSGSVHDVTRSITERGPLYILIQKTPKFIMHCSGQICIVAHRKRQIFFHLMLQFYKNSVPLHAK